MPYFLLDLARTLTTGTPCYWRGTRYGYTYKIETAGIFEKETAENIVTSDKDNNTVMIHVDTVAKILMWDLKSHEG
jgi:phosphoribosyl-AMP cyclohydrolase